MRLRITRQSEMVREGLGALVAGLRRIIFSGDFVGAQRRLYFLGWTPSDKEKNVNTENQAYEGEREWRHYRNGVEGAYDVLDHGYLTLKRTWGSDEEIIETARMSTKKSGFLGWEPGECPSCNGRGHVPVDPGDGSCHDCAGKGTIPGDAKLLKYLYENKHSTPFEFAGLTIECQAPIMVYREWHRHRTQSYSEMSARYVQMPNLHYVPSVKRIIDSAKKSANRQASGGGVLNPTSPVYDSQEMRAEVIRDRIREEQASIYRLYDQMLSWGVSKEVARLNTPVSRYSRMRATGNLRNWLAFLTLRMDPHAQFEIRQYAWCVADVISRAFPRTWALHFKSMGPEVQEAA